jgi:hypothetical protein
MQAFAADQPKPVLIRSTFVPLLRKWIVEDGFFKAAKLVRPHAPTFEIVTIPNAIKLCKAGVYEHWMAMIQFGAIGVGTGLLTEIHRESPPVSLNPVKALHPAQSLFKQKMFFWKDRFYTRHDVVWIHANRLGGVHLDFRRKANETHIDEIKNYLGFEVQPHTYQMLIGRDIEVARADPARRDRIYDATELVAMDTARIFAKGISDSRRFFQEIL